jgi:hypothetical protein
MALPPKTSRTITDVYRTAYDRTIKDPEFLEGVKKISDDFVPMRNQEVESLIHKLDSLPNEATEYMTVLLHKQGLQVQ